ncbi:hypothetical protein LLE49_21885 [Alicyclobacillus tolerans]|uniref:hypothetical protein n=1 Tax=Alicyclobacillus tolerans TaxID=90970 RepID=UPI001F38A8A2|nr:hypothetical protein [Alicyclobacillus tolerans]MCF8567376.1 hypothetical protein [Alicyclobacillus tolerans]
MKRATKSKSQSYQEAIAVNAVVFLAIYAIIHWLTSDEFNHRYENLVVVFAILRIITGFGIILPEKERKILSV